MARIEADQTAVERSVLAAVTATRGHFLYESGHHGDLWLDLDALFMNARRARGWASALARGTALCRADLVCGPLTGGAFVALWLAAETGAGFSFSERSVSAVGSVQYRIPASLRDAVDGSRALLVDDVINAGSATLATLSELTACGAELVGLASFITLGAAASRIAELHGVPLFTLASLDRDMWTPDRCPLCGAGLRLVDHFH